MTHRDNQRCPSKCSLDSTLSQTCLACSVRGDLRDRSACSHPPFRLETSTKEFATAPPYADVNLLRRREEVPADRPSVRPDSSSSSTSKDTTPISTGLRRAIDAELHCPAVLRRTCLWPLFRREWLRKSLSRQEQEDHRSYSYCKSRHSTGDGDVAPAGGNVQLQKPLIFVWPSAIMQPRRAQAKMSPIWRISTLQWCWVVLVLLFFSSLILQDLMSLLSCLHRIGIRSCGSEGALHSQAREDHSCRRRSWQWGHGEDGQQEGPAWSCRKSSGFRQNRNEETAADSTLLRAMSSLTTWPTWTTTEVENDQQSPLRQDDFSNTSIFTRASSSTWSILSSGPILFAAAQSDALAMAEFFHMVEESIEHVPAHMTICQFGLPPFNELLTHQIFARFTKPKWQETYVHFLHVDGDTDENFKLLQETYRKELADGDEIDDAKDLKMVNGIRSIPRVHAFKEVSEFDSYCSMIILSLHHPHVSFEDVSFIAKKIPSIFLAYIKTETSCHENQLECRWMSQSWEAVLGEASNCGSNVCLGMVPSDAVFDQVQAQSPMMDCTEFLDKESRPASWTTQWQQDWFVYHNFFVDKFSRPTSEEDDRGDQDHVVGGVHRSSKSAVQTIGASRGRSTSETTFPLLGSAFPHIEAADANRQARTKFYFAEVGAYHPFKYSNTLLFEKCLHWDGICVEPNPYHAHLFKTYRRCQLVPHCVWSHEKTVTMSFAKDMIEAAVPDDDTGDIPDINSYDLQQQAKKPSHQFEAVCYPLDLILSAFFDFPKNEFGQRIVDYISLDAEHAEVEILKVFPFSEYDIQVWLIEVQPDNFYAVDSILLSNGFGKVAVLGGDHVYMKLGNLFTRLDIPASARKEADAIMGNKTHGFHEHKKPKIDYSTNRPRSALKKSTGSGSLGEDASPPSKQDEL
ncbi:unnamed protein product [Amoebophrya sp. A25]|nr:unnamed protein product [Amoebophrya sp. A25]|eukprot:GSA25T00004522001.1